MICYPEPRMASSTNLSSLCQPLDPYLLHESVYYIQDARISIRPLSLPQDETIIRDWVKNEYDIPNATSDVVANLIIESFVEEAQCNYAQVFTVLSSDEALGEVELLLGNFSDIPYKPKLGDYLLRLFMRHDKLNIEALNACIQFFFTDDKVKRLLVPCRATGNRREAMLLKASGFKVYRHIDDVNERITLYAYKKKI